MWKAIKEFLGIYDKQTEVKEESVEVKVEKSEPTSPSKKTTSKKSTKTTATKTNTKKTSKVTNGSGTTKTTSRKRV